MIGVTARNITFVGLAVAALATLWWEGYQDTPKFQTYLNSRLGFTLEIPANWAPYYRVQSSPYNQNVKFMYVPHGEGTIEPLLTITAQDLALPQLEPLQPSYVRRDLATSPDGVMYYAVWLPNSPYGGVDGQRYALMARDLTNVMNSFRLAPSAASAALPELVGSNTGIVCAQVITSARNPVTGQVKFFPTPCSVPSDWQVMPPQPI